MTATDVDFVIACGSYEQLLFGFDVALSQLDAARDDTPLDAAPADIAEVRRAKKKKELAVAQCGARG